MEYKNTLKSIKSSKVYDAEMLAACYGKDYGYDTNGSSPARTFTHNRVEHELKLVSRHVANMVTPFGLYLGYKLLERFEVVAEGETIDRQIAATVAAMTGGVILVRLLAKVACGLYEIATRLLGVISNRLDPFGHWDYLETKRPYIGEKRDYCKIFLVYFMVGVFFAVIFQILERYSDIDIEERSRAVLKELDCRNSFTY